MFYFIGLGLADERDITVKGLEIVKRAERVYLEAYTAILMVGKEKLEAFYGRSIIIADREMVESSSDEILENADKVDVAFLVVGDPFGATTHTDLLLRARDLSISTQTINNASILTGISATGLSLYNFGQTTSMVFFTEDWRPASFYDRLAENAKLGLHSLILLDIKVKEPDLKALTRTGKLIYEPPRFMSVSQCVQQMLEVEADRGEGVCAEDRIGVGVARIGADDMAIAAGTLKELANIDLGKPLHSVVLLGSRTYDLERQYLRVHAADKDVFDQAWAKGYQSI